jgi:glycosyl transferase, family 25
MVPPVRTKIWVISVGSAIDRRAAFSESARHAACDWSFWDASTSLSTDTSFVADDALVRNGRRLAPGELGCYSSHFLTWKWLTESDHDQMIVLEDDVTADWALLSHLAQIDWSQQDVHLLRLFAKIPPRWRPIAWPYLPVDRYHHLIRFTGNVLGTQAYVLTRRGAGALVRAGRRILRPVDSFLDEEWTHGLLNLGLFPFPVFEAYKPSGIGDARLDREPLTAGQALQHLLRRVARKVRLLASNYGPQPAAARRLRRRLSG